jgi:GR25 family glycosyltransferase involved in LPS biosynthesis
MNTPNSSLRTVNGLLRSGNLAEARRHIEQLKKQRPGLSVLYESKIAEIQSLERLASEAQTLHIELPSETRSDESIKLEHLIFVTASCVPNETKRRAIESTWGEVLRRRGVRHYFVIGSPGLDRVYRLGQVLYVPCRDDYESLLLKLALAYEYLLSIEKNFTHIFKIDDDCYLNLQRFERDLMEVRAWQQYIAGAIQAKEDRINRKWHFGKCSDPGFDREYPFDNPPAPYAKGGYGYFLSRVALGMVVSQIQFFRKELEDFIYSYEDLRIGDILNSHGIQLDCFPTYEVAPPSSPSVLNCSVVYDISDTKQFHRYHQEMAVSSLVQGDAREFALHAYSEGIATNDTLGFDHIYLVNLRCAVDRRTAVQWSLNQAGLSYEIFSAFDGFSSLGQELLKMVSGRAVGELPGHLKYSDLEKWRGGKFLDSPGAVGYILTYVRILLDAQSRGFCRILILEDDVLLRHDFRVHLARLLDKLDPNYKVLMLGASQYNWDSVDISKAEEDGYYRPRALDTCGSFAIAINITIADELIRELLCFNAPFDHIPMGQIYERYPNQCHVAYPNIIIPDVGASYIREGRDQVSHAHKMRWPLEYFDYPRRSIRIGLVLCEGAELCSPPREDLGVELFCYRVTADGLRPIHGVGMPTVKRESITIEEEVFFLEQTQSLPVDALFASKRSCDGGEVVMEALDIARRFGAQDGRSREWLRSIPNKIRPTKRGLAAVIIPTKGRTDAFVKALESVLEQDYLHKEITVIDENEAGSAIACFVRNHVTGLQKSGVFVKLICHNLARNAAAARNTGLLATQAEFVSFLDDDDAYLPGRLSRVIALLSESSATTGGSYCGYLGWNSKISDPARYPSDAIPRRLLNLEHKTHYVSTPTVTYRRDALLSVNGYDESFRRHQDLEMNVRVFKTWEINAYPDALVQLNPLPPDNSNKLYDADLFDVKARFLSKFEVEIGKLGLDSDAIFTNHVKEMINFTRDPSAVQDFALNHPSRFSLHYLDAVKSGNKLAGLNDKIVRNEGSAANKVFKKSRFEFPKLHDLIVSRSNRTGQSVKFWWRDDDAVARSNNLEYFLRFVRQNNFPLAVSVIMGKCHKNLGETLCAEKNVDVLVHGWRHESAVEGKIGEFRDISLVQVEEIAKQALDTGYSVFGNSLVPVIVPPWNFLNIDQYAAFRKLGYLGVSQAFGENKIFFTDDSPFYRADIHVDLTKWDSQPSAKPIDLVCEEICGAIVNDGIRCIGLLTHHRNQAAIDILQKFAPILDHLRSMPEVKFLSARQLFGAGQGARDK